jgi:hypothetical protein
MNRFETAFAERAACHPRARRIPTRVLGAIVERVLADDSLRRRLTPPTTDAERELGEVLRSAAEHVASGQVTSVDDLAAAVLKPLEATHDH